MARLRHLVVIIPGIGGSVLVDASRSGKTRYDLTAPGLASALLHTDRLGLDMYPNLVPTGLVSGFTALAPLVTLPGYSRLCQIITNSFPNVVIDTYRPPRPIRSDADVVLFPYDFRRSVAAAAARLDDAIREALGHRPTAPGDRPVIIVAHSMGGLVARYWLAAAGGRERCHALLTLGTPHRGAPKALDWLVNGAGAGPMRLRRATEVIRGWPAVYELLPQYEAVLDQTDGGPGRPLELTELPAGLISASPGLARYAGDFARGASDGRLVHQAIADEWAARDPDQAPRVTAFMGRGHGTLGMAVLASNALQVVKTNPPWRGNPEWGGDGTVPMLSAIPREQGEQPDRWQVLTDRHGPMGSAPEAVRLLGLYSGDRPPTRGGETPPQPWLGLDIEEFAVAGADLETGVALLPEPLDGTSARVTLAPFDGTPGEPVMASLKREVPGSAKWRGQLPGRPPGLYELAAEVTGVPHHGAVMATAQLMVLGEAELAREDR